MQNRRHPHAAYPRRRPLYVIPDDVAHHCITASDFYERPVAPQPTVLQRIGPVRRPRRVQPALDRGRYWVLTRWASRFPPGDPIIALYVMLQGHIPVLT